MEKIQKYQQAKNISMPSPKIAAIKTWIIPPRGDAFILCPQSRVLVTGQHIIDNNNGTLMQPQQRVTKISISLIVGMKTINKD